MGLTDFGEGFEEDDRLRSDFVRELVGAEPTERGGPAVVGASRIPKTLVRFWHDREALPDDVRECLDSWEALRGEGFAVETFDDATAARFIGARFADHHVRAFGRCRHPAMRSDYFRLCFVLEVGGFYVDADDVLARADWRVLYTDDKLKLQPLCYDVAAGSMVPTAAIWRPDAAVASRIFYVNNNPIVAPPGHPVLRRALQRATAALLGPAPAPEIQSTTGPGNLTAALAAHARDVEIAGGQRDFTLMRDWDRMARTRWELSYRGDARNWRNMDRHQGLEAGDRAVEA